MNRHKFERVGKGVSKNGQTPAASAVGTEVAPYQMIHPQRKPLRPMVIGRTFLCNQYWMLIFKQATSLSRSGRQTADNLVHRATRSKMTVFKTTPCFGVMVRTKPIFRSSGGLRKNEQTPAENTVTVCDTISRMPKMSPVRINRDTIRLRSLLLKNERKYYLPKTKDRFRFSLWGSEKT